MSTEVSERSQSLMRLAGLPSKGGKLMTGGVNNLLTQYSSDGQSWVLKEYGPVLADGHDRFQSEMDFYDYLETLSGTSVPERLFSDPEERFAVFSHINGKPAVPLVHAELAGQFLDFLRDLNPPLESRPKLPDASEACYSIDAHLNCVEGRLQFLRNSLSNGIAHHEARELLDVLVLEWSRLRQIISDSFSLDEQMRVLAMEERWLSPSDIGWHNTLVLDDKRLIFLDFEYGGWDDPAKTLADLFEHPDSPLPVTYWDFFLNEVVKHLDLPSAFCVRATSLRRVYRFKWLLIVLNEFIPQRFARRVYALGETKARSRLEAQLVKARKLQEMLYFN